MNNAMRNYNTNIGMVFAQSITNYVYIMMCEVKEFIWTKTKPGSILSAIYERIMGNYKFLKK